MCMKIPLGTQNYSTSSLAIIGELTVMAKSRADLLDSEDVSVVI